MSGSTTLDLPTAYLDLNKACNSQSYQRVISVSSKILSKYPSEFKAFQCKVVALIKTEKYDECLGLIKKYPDLRKYIIFEKAYTEYRLNRIEEALKTLNDAEDEDLRVLELKAQLHYRREEFQEAYTYLRHVIKNSHDDLSDERITNLIAIAAAAACFKHMPIDLKINADMYEGKFNMACYFLGLGEIDAAECLLQEAEELGRRLLSEDPDITEDEILEELSPMRAQRAYILQKQKKEDLAAQIYQSIGKNRNADPTLMAVVANNIVCINREQNIFDSRKRLKVASADDLQHKLFSRQRSDITLNQGLFHWLTNQVDAYTAKVRSVLHDFPDSPRAILMMAAQLLREKQIERAVSLLKSHSSKTDRLDMLLALAQLSHLASTDRSTPGPEQALALSRLMGELLPAHHLHRLGVMSTRAALILMAADGAIPRAEAVKSVADIIQAALDWHEANQSESAVRAQLLDRSSSLLLELGQAELAARLCERQLAETDAPKQALTTRLVLAYTQFDRAKAEQVCRSLSFAETLSSADVDALETSFLYGAKAVRRQTARATADGDDRTKANAPATGEEETGPAKTRRRRKKHRKIRLPKNYQPGVMPDPDRWLPRRERGHFRGKRRDKRHGATRGGPQGQVSGGAEWDASTRSPNVVAQPSSQPETPKQAAPSARQQQHRKGRKKGR